MLNPTSSQQSEKAYRLLVPGSHKSLGGIRWVINRLAADAGWSVKEIGELETAVDEVCANVVEHAYGVLMHKPPIHLEIRVSSETICIYVMDRGLTYNCLHQEPPTFPAHWQDEGHERGAGLFLIRCCVDELRYESTPDGKNSLLLKKNRFAPAEKNTGQES